jgi:hypothetical protein
MATNFNYFDQFPPMEINLNSYLDAVKSGTGYDYKFTNIQPVRVTLSNIFEKIDLIVDFKKDILNFEPYVISETERIENVSYEYYGTSDHWWVVAIFNNIKNMFTDWPMSEAQLATFADTLYDNGNGLYTKNTYYELLFERNETKRNILLPKPLTISTITARFRTAFQESQI